jgi:hypothetical protein
MVCSEKKPIISVLNGIEEDVTIPQTPDGKHPRAQNQTHDDGNAHHEC